MRTNRSPLSNPGWGAAVVIFWKLRVTESLAETKGFGRAVCKDVKMLTGSSSWSVEVDSRASHASSLARCYVLHVLGRWGPDIDNPPLCMSDWCLGFSRLITHIISSSVLGQAHLDDWTFSFRNVFNGWFCKVSSSFGSWWDQDLRWTFGALVLETLLLVEVVGRRLGQSSVKRRALLQRLKVKKVLKGRKLVWWNLTLGCDT